LEYLIPESIKKKVAENAVTPIAKTMGRRIVIVRICNNKPFLVSH